MVQSKPCVASIQAEIENPMKQRTLNEMAMTLNFLDGLFNCDRTFGYSAGIEKCNLIVPGHQAIGLGALKFIYGCSTPDMTFNGRYECTKRIPQSVS